MEIRTLREGELEQAWELDRDAFHAPPEARERFLGWHEPERFVGAFEAGRLLAMSGVHPLRQFFGERSVATGGVASVAVVPDRRGAGLGRQVVAGCLRAMRERGEVLSTLYPATTRVYRALGYEISGCTTWRGVAPRALERMGHEATASVRPVAEGDHEALHACYARLARETNGCLDRDARRWSYLHVGTWKDRSAYLAEGPDGTVEGYLIYQQLDGEYSALGGDFQLACDEVVWTTRRAGAALWRLLGSWAPQVERIFFRGGAEDALALLMPEQELTVLASVRWMSRVVDAEGAVAQRGFPAGLELAVAFELEDEELPENAGRYWLRVEKGRGALERGGPGGTRLTAGAFGSLFTGYATPETLARAGLLGGGSAEDRAALRAAFAGPTPWMLDDF